MLCFILYFHKLQLKKEKIPSRDTSHFNVIHEKWNIINEHSTSMITLSFLLKNNLLFMSEYHQTPHIWILLLDDYTLFLIKLMDSLKKKKLKSSTMVMSSGF